jgi:hypothetical protein
MAVVLAILYNRRKNKSLERARNLVLGAHGDLAFGPPEPLRSSSVVQELYSGGEIDPVTGEMKLIGGQTFRGSPDVNQTGAPLQRGGGSLPDVWSGVNHNPLFEMAMDAGGMIPEDQLDNLSDFNDEDFEMLADSILGQSDAALEGAMLRAPQQSTLTTTTSRMKRQVSFGGVEIQGASPDILDDLSDFEDLDDDNATGTMDDTMDDLDVRGITTHPQFQELGVDIGNHSIESLWHTRGSRGAEAVIRY